MGNNIDFSYVKERGWMGVPLGPEYFIVSIIDQFYTGSLTMGNNIICVYGLEDRDTPVNTAVTKGIHVHTFVTVIVFSSLVVG